MKYISTTTEDGINFKGQLFESESSKKIILHIHGMAGDIYTNCFYPEMAKTYSENGLSFLVVEHRGTKSVSQFNTSRGVQNIGNAYEIFEDCVFDIKAWVEKAKNLGYEEIWLQAHSLGTLKVVYFKNKVKNPLVKGLILISPADMQGLVKDPIGKADHDICIKEAEVLATSGKEMQLLSHDLWGSMRLSARTYLNFFKKGSVVAIFNYDDSNLGWKMVNSIEIPVLAITGTKDDGVVPVMDAHKAFSILEKELTNCPRKRMVVFEGAEHDFLGFEKAITKEVVSFISAA